jgi:hypothetical protein
MRLMPKKKTEIPFSPRTGQPKFFDKMFVSAKMWEKIYFLYCKLLSIKFREFLGKFFAKVKIFLILAKVFAIFSL